MYKRNSIRIRVLIFVLMIGLIALSTGCAGAATTSVPSTTARVPGSLDFLLLDESVKSTFPETINSDAYFLMRTDKDEYPTDTTKIPFTIENRSDRDMMTGEPYALEVFRDNVWYSVPYKKLDGNMKRAWPAIAYLISAKDSWSSSVSLSEHIPLTPGRYRLVKEIMTQERENRQNIFICAEFHVILPERKTGTITRSEGSYINRPFAQSIEFSDAAVMARLVSRDTDKDGTIRNRMVVSNVIYGDITEPVIQVHQASSEFGFIENVDYVLILYKVDIVTNPGPRYYLVDDCEFRLDEKKERFTVKTRAQITMTEPFVESYQAFRNMILSIKTAQSAVDSLSKSQNRYVISDDLNFIYQHSEVVARVRMEQLVISGTYAVLMDCSVLDVYKGKLPQNVRIHLFLGPEVGDEYLVMVNATIQGQEQTTYSLSSRKSQFSVDTKEYARFRGTYFE